MKAHWFIYPTCHVPVSPLCIYLVTFGKVTSSVIKYGNICPSQVELPEANQIITNNVFHANTYINTSSNVFFHVQLHFSFSSCGIFLFKVVKILSGRRCRLIVVILAMILVQTCNKKQRRKDCFSSAQTGASL